MHNRSRLAALKALVHDIAIQIMYLYVYMQMFLFHQVFNSRTHHKQEKSLKSHSTALKTNGDVLCNTIFQNTCTRHNIIITSDSAVTFPGYNYYIFLASICHVNVDR